MRVFKNRAFNHWAKRVGLTDESLCEAVAEIEKGLVDTYLGSGLVKKRIALDRGKRGGARTLLAFKKGQCAFFVYGFSKASRDNISPEELVGLRRLVRCYFELSVGELRDAIKAGALSEIC